MDNLILGDGLLRSEIRSQTEWDMVARSQDEWDITMPSTFERYFKYDYNPLINCVGFTETYSTDREQHWNVNYVGVSNLVDYCLHKGRKLVHISTDYLYSGSYLIPTEEYVPVHCNNWYGYTKLLAEGYIQLKLPVEQYLIIRTSFKPRPFPFSEAFENLHGNFDYVDVIASLIIDLIEKNAEGIYNVGTETKSMYDLAVRTRPDVEKIFGKSHDTMPESVIMDIDKMKKFLEAE
jgi:dTDP-4-dehydrorhamnose reductase